MNAHHTSTPAGKPRARALGIPFHAEPGRWNAITDVPGVELGMLTLIKGDAVRTGVTVIHPRGRGEAADPCIAGFHSQNGQGEITGVHWVVESGTFSDRAHEHARRGRGARGDRPVDGRASPGGGRRLAPPRGRGDPGRPPERNVVNAGAARFLDGGPISMTAEDVIATARHAPYATLVAVHLEVVNHCPMTRYELRRHLVAAGLDHRVHVPEDGEGSTSSVKRFTGFRRNTLG
jgi:hypothetical protein